MQAFVVYLLWRCPEPASYHPVGRLVRVRGDRGNRYEFTYLRGAKFCHEQYGFQPIAGGFPDPSRRYLSNELFPFFANRVMSKTRLDYASYLDYLGLPADPGDTLLALARGGKKATDSFETFEYPRYDAVTDRMIAHFWLRGIRHIPGADERCLRLKPDQQLYPVPDPDNPADPDAVALYRDSNQPPLGYLAQVLTSEFERLSKRADGDPPHFFVVRVNPPPAPVQQRVLCRMEAHWAADYRPFTDDIMQPLAPDAWDLVELMDARTRELRVANPA